jgi:predicted Zn-dependent protease
MLKEIDLEKIFKVARQLGFSFCDLYAERSGHTRLNIQGRIEAVRVFNTGGLSLRAFDGKILRHFSTSHPSTEALLEQMTGHYVLRRPLPPVATISSALAAKEKIESLKLVSRGTWNDFGGARCQTFSYEDRVTEFEVASQNGDQSHGREESASLVLQWMIQGANRRIPLRSERHRSSIAALLNELKTENPFRTQIKRSLNLANPWPSPSGEMPVLLSARAFAKICLHFLRAFEGDLFLGNLSFLGEMVPPFPVHFSALDRPGAGAAPCDHEGSPRRHVPLLKKGRPKGLACNRWVADQLSVKSTGHCRRQSYEMPPTVALWNPEIIGETTTKNPLTDLEWGLSVHDLEVLKFNPLTAEITLRLGEIALVHHGEEGEVVEPVTLVTHLFSLLGQMKRFSETSEPVGLRQAKQGQELVTEISAPQALADSLKIPGEVPLSHYW